MLGRIIAHIISCDDILPRSPSRKGRFKMRFIGLGNGGAGQQRFPYAARRLDVSCLSKFRIDSLTVLKFGRGKSVSCGRSDRPHPRLMADQAGMYLPSRAGLSSARRCLRSPEAAARPAPYLDLFLLPWQLPPQQRPRHA